MLARGAHTELVNEFGSTTLSSPKLQAELRGLVGIAYLMQNRRRDGETALREALALDATSSYANIGLARLAAGERDFAGAAARASAALAGSLNNEEALL